MNKSVILFGAGASYGSDTSNSVPVLGNDLFNALRCIQPNIFMGIKDELIQLLKNDFEKGIQKLSEDLPHMLPPIQRLMAKYFFPFIPSKYNLYLKLATELKKSNWYGSLITLNYDRLLERSFLATYYNLGIGFESDPNKRLIELCLPHGVCNLFCESAKGSARDISFSGNNVTTNGEIVEINDSFEFERRINNDAFPPVMSYFEPNKATTSGASFIDNQRIRYKHLIENANKIVLVGLKLRTHDQHIWEPIKVTDASILYVSGNHSGIDFCQWCNENRAGGKNEILYSYFYEGFNRIIKYLVDEV